MPTYTFRFPASLPSLPVTVYPLTGGVRGASAATGTTGSDATFTTTLAAGDYLAVVQYRGTETGVRESLTGGLADNVVTTDQLNDATSDARVAINAALGRSDLYLAKRDGGCVGDGTTDDTAAISAAMDAANAAGKVLFFEPGTYVCAAIVKSYSLTVNMTPAATILATNTGTYTWTFQGSAASTLVISAAARGDRSLTATGNTYVADDLLLIGDDTVPYSGNATRKQGQLVAVDTVSGATVNLKETVYEALVTNPVAAKITPVVGVSISGNFRMSNPAASTNLGGFIQVIYGRNVDIDMTGQYAGAAGVNVLHCYNFRVNARAKDYYDQAITSLAQFGYGVGVGGASSHGDVHVIAERVRHAFSATGTDNSYGEPQDIRVSGVAYGTTSQAWDAHAQSCDISFEGVRAYGCRSYGVSLRGRRMKASGSVDNCQGGVWLFDAPTEITLDLKVSNIRSTASDTSGVPGSGVRVNNAITGLKVLGEFHDVDGSGVRFASSATDVYIAADFRNMGKAGVGGEKNGVRFLGATTRCVVSSVFNDNQGSRTTLAGVEIDSAGDVTVAKSIAINSVPLMGTGTGVASAVLGANFTAGSAKSGTFTATSLAATGLTGATAASRHAGGTASGAPASGTYLAGDFVVDQTGALWVCTAAGTPGTWAKVGGTGSGAPGSYAPSDLGLLAWTCDPAVVASSGFAPTLSQVVLVRQQVPASISVTNVCFMTSATGTLTAAYVGLYSSAGALLGQSAECSATLNTAGAHSVALTGGPIAVTGGTGAFVWAAILQVGSAAAQLAKVPDTQGTTFVNSFGVSTAATMRFGYSAGTNTTLPASFTPSGSTMSGHGIWAALS